ncbi:hypothetical protein [Actinoplanes sp. N902-109]|uniref:hypothetical protein n=1 Tax=Actinoplanes sp. (strain N902-109) TaxID=649831 RepID=UPI0005A119DB|nr:hypothetical protein [Actinoplanes sp. N902-109]
MNGWAARESPWSAAGAALDADGSDPASWRRPVTEVRPYARERGLPTDPPAGDGRPYSPAPPPPSFQPAPEAAEALTGPAAPVSPAPRPTTYGGDRPVTRASDTPTAGRPVSAPPAGGPPRLDNAGPPRLDNAAGPPRLDNAAGPRWSDGRARYSDLLNHLSPNGGNPQQRPPEPPPRPDPLSPELLHGEDTTQVRPMVPPRPASAPPAAARRADWNDAARHAQPTPAEGLPAVTDESRSGDQRVNRPSYDPSSFPRRLPYEPPLPAFTRSGDPGSGPTGEQTFPALPQRVPAQPDVPTVPEPPSVEPSAETPALARIATHLRRDDALSSQERREGFDVDAILTAVREVDGVRDAALRTTPAGAHSLRLDLAEGADPAEVSRQVARLLQDRMGLDAAMQGAMPLGAAPPAPAPRSAPPAPAPRSVPPARPVSPPPVAPPQPVVNPLVPNQPNPTGRPLPQRVSTSENVRFDDAAPRPLLAPNGRPGPRIQIENVLVNTFGSEATVNVRLAVNGQIAEGEATGPAVDGYLLRLCATATASAVDQMLAHSNHAEGPAKCFVEHAAAVPFGSLHVAVVVVLLATDGWVEQLAGSAVITGDDRHAMVRATLAAVNRRLEALLS